MTVSAADYKAKLNECLLESSKHPHIIKSNNKKVQDCFDEFQTCEKKRLKEEKKCSKFTIPLKKCRADVANEEAKHFWVGVGTVAVGLAIGFAASKQ